MLNRMYQIGDRSNTNHENFEQSAMPIRSKSGTQQRHHTTFPRFPCETAAWFGNDNLPGGKAVVLRFGCIRKTVDRCTNTLSVFVVLEQWTQVQVVVPISIVTFPKSAET